MSIIRDRGLPGLRNLRSTAERVIFRQMGDLDLAGGKYIDGSQSRDPGNTPDLGVLRCGLLMGQITAATFGTVGQYAPAIIGVTTGAYTSGGTSLAVGVDQAVEIARICGQAGTAELVCIGPPSAAGTVAVTSVTHSAIDTATGILTVSSLGVNKIAGSFLAINDGRYVPRTFIPDGSGLRVFDPDGAAQTTEFPEVPISGVVYSANFLPAWPSDTSLQGWIVTQLNSYGKFVFDHNY